MGRARLTLVLTFVYILYDPLIFSRPLDPGFPKNWF